MQITKYTWFLFVVINIAMAWSCSPSRDTVVYDRYGSGCVIMLDANPRYEIIGNITIDYYYYHDSSKSLIKENEKINWAFYDSDEVEVLTELSDSLYAWVHYPEIYYNNAISCTFRGWLIFDDTRNIDSVIVPENWHYCMDESASGIGKVMEHLRGFSGKKLYWKELAEVDSFLIQIKFQYEEGARIYD